MRASSITFASAIASFSIIYMPLVGWFLSRFNWEVPITETYTLSGWRIHMLLNLLPGVLALLLIRKLPESPKYLKLVDRDVECLEVLRLMYETNTGNSRIHCPVKHLKASYDHSDKTSSTKDNKSL